MFICSPSRRRNNSAVCGGEGLGATSNPCENLQKSQLWQNHNLQMWHSSIRVTTCRIKVLRFRAMKEWYQKHPDLLYKPPLISRDATHNAWWTSIAIFQIRRYIDRLNTQLLITDRSGDHPSPYPLQEAIRSSGYQQFML